MSSSCIEEVSVPNDDWYRIAAELLGRAGIEINGSAPSDLRVKNPLFFKRVCRKVRWVRRKSIWTAGGNASVWIYSSTRCYAPGWKSSSHTISKTHSASQALVCLIYKVKNVPGLSVKSTTTSATISSAGCLIPICNIPAVTGKRRRASRRPAG